MMLASLGLGRSSSPSQSSCMSMSLAVPWEMWFEVPRWMSLLAGWPAACSCSSLAVMRGKLGPGVNRSLRSVP